MNVKTVIKIFLPQGCPPKADSVLYGHKRSEESNSTSFYVLTTSSDFHASSTIRTNLPTLGVFGADSGKKSSGISLIGDSQGKIVKVKLDGEELRENSKVVLMYYDRNKFLNCYDESYCPNSVGENFSLFIAKELRNEQEKENGKSGAMKLISSFHSFLSTFTSLTSKVLQPLALLFQNTVIYRHCSNWRKCLNDERSLNGFIFLDVLLGFIFFLLMYHVQHSGKYFMISTEFMVNKLRALLEMLDGSPAGLKLNVQLNNFLLSCFMYHVDLWWNFIRIIEPAIQYIFLPITMFGLMGFSFQCAILCDLVTLITLHAHCFYIYAAMLYKLELYSIRSLLRIVLGRRLNVLKNRVESQSYSNRQLFLATLFFTTLLFLLPTVLIYYLVFASLRLLIYCLSYSLMSLQYKILTFPFYKYLRWVTGSYIDASSISINFLSRRCLNNVDILELELINNSSVPWKKSPFVKSLDCQLVKPISIDTFAKYLVKGEMMAFLPKI